MKKHNKPFNRTLSLCRYGGLNLVNQKGNYGNDTFHSAPERVGTYAFIFPYIELFLIGSTRINEFKDGTYKKFNAVSGTVWTHLEPKERRFVLDTHNDCWFKVDVVNMNNIIRQNYAQETKHMARSWQPEHGKRIHIKENLRRNPHSWFSKDHMEVFITRETKIQ